MSDSTTRTIQGLGWLLVIAAALVLVGVVGYAMFFSGESSWVVWVVGALYLGFGVLLLSVLRQRLIERKTDKYEDVEI